MGGDWTVVGNIQALVGESNTMTLYMFRKISGEEEVDPGMGIPGGGGLVPDP